VAGLLHDIGIFVGLRGHHKHGQYILMASESSACSRDDLEVVSNVARYHGGLSPRGATSPTWRSIAAHG